jgi:ABC-type branched-subunit amino acid transport system substrate-binding protein
MYLAADSADPSQVVNFDPPVVIEDTPCETGNACPLQKAVGLVGAASSGVSAAIQNVAQIFKVPQCSYSSTAGDLSVTEFYPYFTRVVAPDAVQAKAMRDLVLKFEWKKVAILAADSAYGKGFMTDVSPLLGNSEVEVLMEQDFPE